MKRVVESQRRGGTNVHNSFVIIKFFRNLIKLENGCWIYSGVRNKKVRGNSPVASIGLGRRRGGIYVHIFSWEYHNNDIVPKGMEVCHKCDYPRCVNPNHLFVGTHYVNMHDMIDKGRHSPPPHDGRPGESHPLVKITEEQAKEIRCRYIPDSRGANGCKNLSIEFGISVRQIRRIASGERWSYLEEVTSGKP